MRSQAQRISGLRRLVLAFEMVKASSANQVEVCSSAYAGVNPMVTVEAVAYVIASRLARNLSAKAGVAQKCTEAA